jgi:hypothetical protein
MAKRAGRGVRSGFESKEEKFGLAGLTLRSESPCTRKAAQPRSSVGGVSVDIDAASETLSAFITMAGISFDVSACGTMAI